MNITRMLQWAKLVESKAQEKFTLCGWAQCAAGHAADHEQ